MLVCTVVIRSAATMEQHYKLFDQILNCILEKAKMLASVAQYSLKTLNVSHDDLGLYKGSLPLQTTVSCADSSLYKGSPPPPPTDSGLYECSLPLPIAVSSGDSGLYKGSLPLQTTVSRVT